MNYEYEINFEQEAQLYFEREGLKVHRSRDLENLASSNVQISFQYEGSTDETRKRVGNFLEYDSHLGSFTIMVTTFRAETDKHHSIVAQYRSHMLNSLNPWSKSKYYHIYDIVPQATDTTEDGEANADQASLVYQIKWRLPF